MSRLNAPILQNWTDPHPAILPGTLTDLLLQGIPTGPAIPTPGDHFLGMAGPQDREIAIPQASATVIS